MSFTKKQAQSSRSLADEAYSTLVEARKQTQTLSNLMGGTSPATKAAARVEKLLEGAWMAADDAANLAELEFRCQCGSGMMDPAYGGLNACQECG